MRLYGRTTPFPAATLFPGLPGGGATLRANALRRQQGFKALLASLATLRPMAEASINKGKAGFTGASSAPQRGRNRFFHRFIRHRVSFLLFQRCLSQTGKNIRPPPERNRHTSRNPGHPADDEVHTGKRIPDNFSALHTEPPPHR
jgi:hypothetical protein